MLQGEAWFGEPAQHRTAGELRRRSASVPLGGSRRARSSSRGIREHLPQAPDAPHVAIWKDLEFAGRATSADPSGPDPARPRDESENPSRTQKSELEFTGATLADSGQFPPDASGDVGPSQYLAAVNGRVRTFAKATGAADGALDLTLDVFFADVVTPPTSTTITAYPRVRFDRHAQRWFVTAIDVPASGGDNRVLIAVSSGATISAQTSFAFYAFSHSGVTPAGDTGCFLDAPSLGVDANALYVGGNLVCGSESALTGSSGFVVQKASLLGGGPIAVTVFRNLSVPNGSGLFAPRGVDNLDAAATEGAFVGVDAGAFGRLVLRRVSNPGTFSPSLGVVEAITVPATSFPRAVPHLGNTGGRDGRLDAVDDRLANAVVRGGRLWTSQHVLVDASGVATRDQVIGRNGIRWYELNLSQSPAALVQAGTVYSPASNDPLWYWTSSVVVTGQGHAVLGSSVSGKVTAAGAACASRLAGDAAGMMSAPTVYEAGAGDYNPAGDPGGVLGRMWGGTSATSVDPTDDMTAWTLQQFNDAPGSWGIRVKRLQAPPPATPSSVSPSALELGQSNVTITVTGTSSSGSGFFDPGEGFTNRLQASASGLGITVHSVTYMSPTSMALVVSVDAGAVAGTRDITVTNPDGQAATGTALLTVGSPAPPNVTEQPSDRAACEGGSTTFTAGASGTPAPSAQWQRSTDGGTTFSDLTGATGAQLTVTGVSVAMTGYKYRAVFTNASGMATTVAATLSVTTAPAITTQPAESTVCFGDTLQLSVTASSTGALNFQWRKDGLALSDGGRVSGTTSSTLTITGMVASDAGSYDVQVLSVCPTVVSSNASVTVVNCPVSFNSQYSNSVDSWVQDTPSSSGLWALETFAGPAPPAGGYFTTSGATIAGWSTADYPGKFGDFEYEAQMARTGTCTYCSFSLWVRGEPLPLLTSLNRWSRGYLFNIARNGKYSVWRYNDQAAAVALQPWTATPAINQGDGALNTLRVIADGSLLRFIVNGQEVFNTSGDSTFLYGKVGVGLARTTSNGGLADVLRVDYARLDPPPTSPKTGTSATGNPNPWQPIRRAQRRRNREAREAYAQAPQGSPEESPH